MSRGYWVSTALVVLSWTMTGALVWLLAVTGNVGLAVSCAACLGFSVFSTHQLRIIHRLEKTSRGGWR